MVLVVTGNQSPGCRSLNAYYTNKIGKTAAKLQPQLWGFERLTPSLKYKIIHENKYLDVDRWQTLQN